MKQTLKPILTAFAITALAGSFAYAEDKAPQAADAQSMNMDGMKGMMHECMSMHKDGKMCDHETMEKCQAKMSKDDCQKMMKQAKTAEKKESKTKK